MRITNPDILAHQFYTKKRIPTEVTEVNYKTKCCFKKVKPIKSATMNNWESSEEGIEPWGID